MKIRTVDWSPARRSRVVEDFLQRPVFDEKAEAIAAEILKDIKTRHEAAVMAAAAKFDGVSLRHCDLRLSEKEIDEAIASVPETTRRFIQEAHDRVARFSRRSMRRGWTEPTPRGGYLGECYTPFDRVGVYVPGGTAPLASTVIMTATLAQVAGVREIVACTPCSKDKKVNPVVVYAMKLAGVTEIYRVGGIQAIGLMAYGGRKCPPVQKIVGPGGTFVTAAKRLVYGTVALDLVAGPSEIAVLADSSANPRWVAADLLSQAEHGTGFEKSLLVCDDMDTIEQVEREVRAQATKLSRHKLVLKVADRGGILLVRAPSIEDGANLVNQFAPEHLELMVKNADEVRAKIRAAGAVFVGHYTPESAGDFVAGPSHVLPTGGSAKRFSGLTVDDFLRRTSLISYTEEDLRDALPTIRAFGVMEGLDGHSRSAELRCPPEK